MNVATFWGRVFAVRSRLRLLALIQREANPVGRAGSWVEWFFTWPFIALLALVVPSGGGVSLLVLVLLCYVLAFPPLRLNTFEALRMPSRRAVYAARLLDALPWLLWVGVCGAAGLALWGGLPTQHWDRKAAHLLIIAQLPWLWFGLHGAPYLLARSPVAGLGGTAAFFLLFALPNSDFAQLFTQVPPLIWPAVVLLVVLGLVAVQVWAIGLMEPLKQIAMAEAPGTGTRPAAPARPTGKSWKVGPSPVLRGRTGLGPASVYYALAMLWRGFRNALHGKEANWAVMLILGFVMLIAPFAGGRDFRLFDWWWILFFAVVVESPLHLEHPQRLYLLGVNYREQLVHRLKTFWATAAMLVYGLLALVHGIATGRWFEAGAFWAAVVGITLFRAGWWEWPAGSAGPGAGRTALVSMGIICFAVALGTTPGFTVWEPPTRGLVFAAVSGAVGVWGLAYRALYLDEDTLRRAMQG